MQAKGKLRVQVEDTHLKASLIFMPSEEGEVWNVPKIKNLLEEKGIIEGVDEEALKEAVEAFGNAEHEAVKRTAAKGTPAIPPRKAEYHWEIREIPEELQSDGEWVLEKAGAPHITVKKNERVQVEKQVEKKKRLPFSKPQTETVKKWETREWEEPVHVNPEVLESGWAEKGQVLAILPEQEDPGHTGRSVYGKPLPIPELSAKEFYPGQGVESSGNKLSAAHTGFVRRGENWVEILPFEYHNWSLDVSKDKATCFLNFTPGKKDARPPKAEKILQAAMQRDFSEEQLLPSEKIHQILSAAISRQTPLKNYPVTKDRDAWFTVEASSDKLKGLLSLGKGSGRGKPLILKEVGSAIKKSGFKGMDFEKIKQDLQEFFRSNRLEMRDYVLAEGSAPTRGSDRVVTFSCDFVKNEVLEELRNVELPSGDSEMELCESLRDYPLGSVNKMAYVKVGQEIAEITTTEPGQEGQDVYGKTLPGLPGNDPPLSLKENILSKSDKLYANENGILDVIESDEGSTVLRARPYKEARIEVEVSEDRMEAFLSLQESEGLAPRLSMEKVGKVLEDKQVLKGIDSAALSDAILQAKDGEEIERVKIASGNPPVEAGEVGKLKFHVQLASGEQVTIKENGRADFRNQDNITPVEKDQLIAEIPMHSDSNKDGWDISGKTIPANNGQQSDLNIGENIRREEDKQGTVRFYAEKSGELDYDGKSLSVHVLHKVNGNVDLHTGNIKFPGTVQVSGNVQKGFYIMSGCDIQIAGTVEGALLSAGKSVTVLQGVVGGNKAVLRAKEDINAQFVEEATMLTVGDIKIKNSCLRCTVKCNGKLYLTGERGDVVGGKIFTKHGVEAKNIGNSKGVRTTISFGQDYLVADQISQHEKEINRLKEMVTKMDAQMQSYEQKKMHDKLEKVRAEKVKQLKMIEKRSMRLFTLRERYEEHFESEIIVRDTLYPGAVLESHGRFFEVQSPQKNVRIVFNQENGRIEIKGNTEAERQEE